MNLSEEALYRNILAMLVPLVNLSHNDVARPVTSVELESAIFDLEARQPTPVFLDDARKSHVSMLVELAKTFNQRARQINKRLVTLIVAGIDINTADFVRVHPSDRLRLVSVPVARFSSSEIDTLITLGATALNITFADTLKTQITGFSQGLPLVCQNLCYHIVGKAGISETCKEHKSIGTTAFLPGVEEYVEHIEPEFEPHLDKASQLTWSDVRALDVLRAIYETQEEQQDIVGQRYVSVDTVYERIRNSGHYGVARDAIAALAIELAAPDGGEILYCDQNRVNWREPVYRFLYRKRVCAHHVPDRMILQSMAEALAKAITLR